MSVVPTTALPTIRPNSLFASESVHKSPKIYFVQVASISKLSSCLFAHSAPPADLNPHRASASSSGANSCTMSRAGQLLASADRRLNNLEKLRDKVALLEVQQDLLEDWQSAQREEKLLRAVHAARAGRDLADCVLQLKRQLEAVADADLTGDTTLQAITQQHAIRCCISLITDLTDVSQQEVKGAHGVLELAASALCMLSQRPSSHELLHSSGAVLPLVTLTNPRFTSAAVESACCALGNLSADGPSRHSIRSQGGVGALVRLLRSDCTPKMQAAAAAALSLCAARDPVVQDSVRYLGGLEALVELLSSKSNRAAEAARYCLASLKHNNTRNATAILSAIRMDRQLGSDVRRLADALELLGEVAPAPLVAPAPRLDVVEAALMEERIRRETKRSTSPLRTLRSSLDTSISLMRAQLAEASAAAATRKAAARIAATVSPLRASSGRSSGSSTKLAAAGEAGKHLMRYSCDELCSLATEMGFESWDVRCLRAADITGAQLLLLDETELVAATGLSRHKARRMRRLQEAAKLYDCVATRVAQPRLSEVELRLWLAGQGCRPTEIERVLKLLRSLVARDPESPWFTFWEWAAGWQWVTHALEVYGVDWRAAAAAGI